MRVVIVEDEPLLAQLQASLLAGHDVHVVTNHFADLLQPEPWAGTDVAVVDLMLPDLNGEDIIDYLAEHHPGIRRVVSTAMPLHELGQVIPKAHEVLLKPYGADRLRAAVEQLR